MEETLEEALERLHATHVAQVAEAIGRSSLGHLEGSIRTHFGERCADYDRDCVVCQAWNAWDTLAKLYEVETP